MKIVHSVYVNKGSTFIVLALPFVRIPRQYYCNRLSEVKEDTASRPSFRRGIGLCSK